MDTPPIFLMIETWKKRIPSKIDRATKKANSHDDRKDDSNWLKHCNIERALLAHDPYMNNNSKGYTKNCLHSEADQVNRNSEQEIEDPCWYRK